MYDESIILSLRFPQKLWRIVNECESSAIKWSLNGTSILLDYRKFQEQYLNATNSIFKTTNITSFIRQLNLYGFRKVTSHNRDPICNSHNPNVHEFLHENFRIGRPDLLGKVRRKTLGKIKYYHSKDLTASNSETDTPGKSENCMSRLDLCRLELRKVLKEIAQKYHQSQHEATMEWCMNGTHPYKRSFSYTDYNFDKREKCSIKNHRMVHNRNVEF